LGRRKWIVAQERRESERSKNRDKKILMVKLIIQKAKNNTQLRNHKKFSPLLKILEYSLGIQSWYWCADRSSNVFSAGDWLVSSNGLLLSTGQVAIVR
jgi:hypothetical protein